MCVCVCRNIGTHTRKNNQEIEMDCICVCVWIWGLFSVGTIPAYRSRVKPLKSYNAGLNLDADTLLAG